MFQYQEFFDKFKIPIALSLVGIILIAGGILLSPQKQKEYPKESLLQAQKQIQVDVSGAVYNSGVYKLNDGDRVEEAIKAAGGFSDKANKEYISKNINMAQRLSDGAKIYVPFTGESVATNIPTVAGTSTTASKQVNINTSTQAELEALPGIGPVTATKIISGRPYQKIEELVDKKIVSKSIFEKIQSSLTLF